MLIYQERHYKIVQSYASKTENEFEIYDFNNNRAGYIVEDVETNTFEIYHAPEDIQDIGNEDYSEIDYTDNFDDAIEMIVSEISYDIS